MAQRFYVETLGCPKNQVDSEKLIGTLLADGMTPTDDPAAADLVVVNTCAFIDEARRESIDTILALEERRKDGARLVVTGCMAERYGHELAEALPEVDQVAGFGVPVNLTVKPAGRTSIPVAAVPTLDLLIAGGAKADATTASSPLRPPLSSEEQRLGFEPLFDGKSFTGWEQKGNWVIADGAVYRKDKGGDRGKQGQVLAVLTEKNRVIVQGVNLKTKHTRVTQNDRGVKQGGIETVEASIHISNVQLVDPSTKKPTRVGTRVEVKTVNGVKKTVRTRVAKKSGKDI